MESTVISVDMGWVAVEEVKIAGLGAKVSPSEQKKTRHSRAGLLQ
jgi:hypothetical protein